MRVEAQHGTLEVAARAKARLASASGPLSAAAAKKIHLATAGGAAITLEGGNLTVQCPGTLTIHAAKKSFAGASTISREMNAAPHSSFDDAFVLRNPATGQPLPDTLVELVRGDGTCLRVTTDAAGKTPLQKSQFLEALQIRVIG